MNKLEASLLERLYSEHYQHARVAFTTRATYLNIYLVLVGASLAFFFASIANSDSMAASLTLVLIFVASLISIARTELVSSHITHNLVFIRRANKQVAANFAILGKLLTMEGENFSPTKYLEFKRPITNVHKGIEALTALVGAITAAVLYAIYLLPRQDLDWTLEGSIVVSVLVSISACLAVYSYVAGQMETRHRHCCYDNESTVLKTFSSQSRFTFVDRHILPIAILANLLAEKPKVAVLDIGPGVFEPFLLLKAFQCFSANKQQVNLDLVESDPDISQMLKKLVGGERVHLSEIRRVSTNLGEKGERTENDNLSFSALMKSALRLDDYGVQLRSAFDFWYRYFRPGYTPNISLFEGDFFNVKSGRNYDVVFMGALLGNVKKLRGTKGVRSLFESVKKKLNSDGYLCLTVTPAQFLENLTLFREMQSRQFKLVCALPQKIVALPSLEFTKSSELLGDIFVIFAKSDKATFEALPIFGDIYTKFYKDPAIRVLQTVEPLSGSNSNQWVDFWLPVGLLNWLGKEYVVQIDLSQVKQRRFLQFDIL